MSKHVWRRVHHVLIKLFEPHRRRHILDACVVRIIRAVHHFVWVPAVDVVRQINCVETHGNRRFCPPRQVHATTSTSRITAQTLAQTRQSRRSPTAPSSQCRETHCATPTLSSTCRPLFKFKFLLFSRDSCIYLNCSLIKTKHKKTMASVHSGSITIRAAMQHDFNPKDDLLVPVWLDSQKSIALFPSTGGPTHTAEKMVLAAPLTKCTETIASKITVGICYRTPGRGTMCNSSAGEVSIEAVVVQGPCSDTSQRNQRRRLCGYWRSSLRMHDKLTMDISHTHFGNENKFCQRI